MNTDQPIAPCACNDNPALWKMDPAQSVMPPQQTTMPVNSDDDRKRTLLSDISLFAGIVSAALFLFR